MIVRDGTPTVIPAGAVVAFDIENSCPVGWASYRKLGGRMIVGSGDNFNRDQNGERLKEYSFGESGGAETHLMSVEEMPAHKHPGAAVFNDTYLARFRTEGKRGEIPILERFLYEPVNGRPTTKQGTIPVVLGTIFPSIWRLLSETWALKQRLLVAGSHTTTCPLSWRCDIVRSNELRRRLPRGW